MFELPSSVLVVVAHPDDEVLGCGGTMFKLARAGVPVRSCILCADADARVHRPVLPRLHRDTSEAQTLLGGLEPVGGIFPNIQLNTVPHLHLVQFIEEAIAASACDVVFTHHPGDLNNDHLETSRACQAAVRISQRRPGLTRVRAFFYMEVPSATDWALSPGPRFQADTYIEIGSEGVERKLEALRAYVGVMRPFPHPRCDEVIRGLAACRGGESGFHYAEAFETALRLHSWGEGGG